MTERSRGRRWRRWAAVVRCLEKHRRRVGRVLDDHDALVVEVLWQEVEPLHRLRRGATAPARWILLAPARRQIIGPRPDRMALDGIELAFRSLRELEALGVAIREHRPQDHARRDAANVAHLDRTGDPRVPARR